MTTPPVSGLPSIVQEGKNNPESKKENEKQEKPHPSSSKAISDKQTLDEWSEDHTELSLKAIELQIVEDVNTLLKRYTDEADIDHEDIFHPLPHAYSTYQKMTQNFKRDPQDVLSPFLPMTPSTLNEKETERYEKLRFYWDAIKDLRNQGVHHIAFDGESSFYEALEKEIS